MKENKTDIIIDFETMSADSTNCAVIDCSVFVFSWDKFISDDPYKLKDVLKAKRLKLSVKEQVEDYDFKISESTLEFWAGLPSDVRAMIKPHTGDLNVTEFCQSFMDILIESPKISHWWSRSNTFDPVILARLFRSQGKLNHLEAKLPHWSVRDTRTWIDAKFDFPQNNGFCPVSDEARWDQVFKKHNSSWDVWADVMRLQAIARAELDLPQVEI